MALSAGRYPKSPEYIEGILKMLTSLAAAGVSRREIAAKLGIDPRWLESNIRSGGGPVFHAVNQGEIVFAAGVLNQKTGKRKENYA